MEEKLGPYDINVYYKNDRLALEFKKKKKNENNFVLNEACIMNFYFRIVHFNWYIDNNLLNILYTNKTCAIASKNKMRKLIIHKLWAHIIYKLHDLKAYIF